MSRWTEFELFVHVVELGSLGKAAEALGLSTPSASRHLAALEQRLGARLIERSTRRLYVTEVGQGFYQRCKTALEGMKDAVAAVAETTVRPVGTLRVTASLSLLQAHVAPVLPAFMQRHDGVKVELVAANRYYDIIDNNIDLALRTREYEPDSTLIVRRLATTQRILAAAPAYLARHGHPDDPQDLGRHHVLAYAHHMPGELSFQRGDEVTTVHTRPTLLANDGQVLRTAAVAGLGILAQPTYVIYDDLVAGRLVPVMPQWRLPSMAISLVYPRRDLVPAKTRVFMDFLLADFQDKGYEQLWDAAVRSRATASPGSGPAPTCRP